MKYLPLFLLFPLFSWGADKHFEFIQPFDDKVTEALVWEDTDLAGKASDVLMDVLTYVPAPVIYAKTGDKKKAWVAVGAQLSVAGVTQAVKGVSNRTRPNGRSDKSFFSGHTSSAFSGAAIICSEFERECPIALAMAASTGYLRIAAKRHWASDVIVGAFVGYSGGAYIPTVVMGW